VVPADNPHLFDGLKKKLSGEQLSAIPRQEFQIVFNNFSNSFTKVLSMYGRWRPFKTPALICGKLY